jgi:hypothetical protein
VGQWFFLGVEPFPHQCRGASLPTLVVMEGTVELGYDVCEKWDSSNGAGVAGVATPWLTSFPRIFIRTIVIPT